MVLVKEGSNWLLVHGTSYGAGIFVKTLHGPEIVIPLFMFYRASSQLVGVYEYSKCILSIFEQFTFIDLYVRLGIGSLFLEHMIIMTMIMCNFITKTAIVRGVWDDKSVSQSY